MNGINHLKVGHVIWTYYVGFLNSQWNETGILGNDSSWTVVYAEEKYDESFLEKIVPSLLGDPK